MGEGQVESGEQLSLFESQSAPGPDRWRTWLIFDGLIRLELRRLENKSSILSMNGALTDQERAMDDWERGESAKLLRKLKLCRG